MKKLLILLPLLSIYAFFFLYLQYPQLEGFFAFHADASMLFTLGMVAKGHNYGLCEKCGKNHTHPRKGYHLTEEAKRKIGEANRGRKFSLEHRRKLSEALKGRKFSPEHYAKIVEFNRSLEKRRSVSEFFKGRPSHLKGKHLSVKHRLRIALGLRNSKVFREAVRKHHKEKAKEFLRKFYNIPEDVEFFPARVGEHWFARKVLIEGGHADGLISGWGIDYAESGNLGYEEVTSSAT